MNRKSRPNGIEFATTIPEDCLWDEDGEQVVRSGGMALSQVIASLLAHTGMHVSDPEADEEHERWEFSVEWRGARFRIEVVHMDYCMLVVYGGPPLPVRLLSPHAPRREELTETIGNILDGDSRFSDVKLVTAY